MAQNGFDQGSAGCHDRRTLCANNCGLFGSPSTLNMCSKCYSDHIAKSMTISRSPSSSSATPAVLVTDAAAPTSSRLNGSACPTADAQPLENAGRAPASAVEAAAAVDGAVACASPLCQASAPSRPVARCGVCRKRVGLTGFKCRCDGLYCAMHRYSDRHSCTFDYKTTGRMAIAKANPVVIADKVQRF